MSRENLTPAAVSGQSEDTMTFYQYDYGSPLARDESNGSEYETDLDLYEWLDRMTTIQNAIYVYGAPLIILSGVSGNLLSLMILRSRYFSMAACGSLLSVLSVVDTGVLLSGLLRVWIMETFDYDIRIANLAACRLHYFVTYFLQHASSWTVVMVTVERFISVYHPFKAKRLFDRRRLRLAMSAILTLLVLLDCHVLFTLCIAREVYEDLHGNLTIYRCVFPDQYVYGNVIWPWIDCVVLALFPFTVLLTGNAMIVVRVVSKLRTQETLMQQQQHRLEQLQASRRRRNVGSLTLMLFAVTGTFLVTLIPYEVYLIGMGHGTWEINTIRGSTRTTMANVICELIFYVNYAANFLLYCVSGSRFRIALRDYFRRPSQKMRPLMNAFVRSERQISVMSSWS